MNIIVFPGQGSQRIGMGKELSENFVEAKNVFEEVKRWKRSKYAGKQVSNSLNMQGCTM